MEIKALDSSGEKGRAMNTPIIITAIICATLISLALIGGVGK